MFRLNPSVAGAGSSATRVISMEPSVNPVAEATMIIASGTKEVNGKTIQRKISAFLLDGQIVSTATKRRAKSAKASESESELV